MAENANKQKVVVVGAGPVGALAAIYAAARGDDVEIYELRGDLRDPSTTPLNFTKSINLALSERGINSIKNAGVEGLVDQVLKETIPMHARMIHGRTKLGEVYADSQDYDVHGRAIHAVDRAGLNKRLLDSLEAMPNVNFFFNHKLTGADFNKNTAWFERRISSPVTDYAQNPIPDSTAPSVHTRAPEIEVRFDLLIGADGAHSAARYHLMKYARVNYHQEYIDTMWCEFHMSPSPSTNCFAISPHHLHIWPGGTLMFIAIPSLDHSFTCTLFAPSSTFSSLWGSPDSMVPAFFAEHFPGVSPGLISTADLIAQFCQNPHLPLITIKCTPYHHDSSAVILGDAAHAMVPFYGQGMNAGLEDVRVLFDFLDVHYAGLVDPSGNIPSPSSSTKPLSSSLQPLSRNTARAAALAAYTLHRTPDAHTINDLALRNYLEMRSSVTSPLYLFRKRIEEFLYKYFPGLGWSTQYSRVSFGNERYSVIAKRTKMQGLVLALVYGAIVVGSGVGIVTLGLKAERSRTYVRWWRMARDICTTRFEVAGWMVATIG